MDSPPLVAHLPVLFRVRDWPFRSRCAAGGDRAGSSDLNQALRRAAPQLCRDGPGEQAPWFTDMPPDGWHRLDDFRRVG